MLLTQPGHTGLDISGTVLVADSAWQGHDTVAVVHFAGGRLWTVSAHLH